MILYDVVSGCGTGVRYWAQSRHPDRVGECPLSGVKRTSKFKTVTSAFEPKRTSDTLFRFDARTRPRRCINDKGIFLELRGLFGRNDRGDLGNKTGSAFESYVAPQPGYGDNETIPKAN